MSLKQYRFGATALRLELPPGAEAPNPNLQKFEEPLAGRADCLLRARIGADFPPKARLCSHMQAGGEGAYAALLPIEGGYELIYKPAYRRSLGPMRLLQDADIFGILLDREAFVLHAAYIRAGGRAILFTAPSGTGKSTQAALWQRHRGASIINGDRVLIQRDAQGFRACGIPYCGSSGICWNESAPIGALVLLRQGAESHAGPLGGKEAFCQILPQCAFGPDKPAQVAAATGLLAALLEAVPAYCLSCRPDITAVEALEAAMKAGQERIGTHEGKQ